MICLIVFNKVTWEPVESYKIYGIWIIKFLCCLLIILSLVFELWKIAFVGSVKKFIGYCFLLFCGCPVCLIGQFMK